ncbi:MAG: DUF4258 domain-containing protein [Chloroflexi bacterium]|nr:DUF4258 domain-containing protein [Chloroflexota bacterium]
MVRVGSVELRYTEHALNMMGQREIPPEWVERVLESPSLQLPNPKDTEVERFFGRIPEFGNRALRVAVNTRTTPWRVVTVFFDRAAGGL